jgi:hypothetical protein
MVLSSLRRHAVCRLRDDKTSQLIDLLIVSMHNRLRDFMNKAGPFMN